MMVQAFYHSADFFIRAAFFDEMKESYKSPTALNKCKCAPPCSKNTTPSHQLVSMKRRQYGLGDLSFADEAVLAWENFRFAVVCSPLWPIGLDQSFDLYYGM
jgi:hypothetical protein